MLCVGHIRRSLRVHIHYNCDRYIISILQSEVVGITDAELSIKLFHTFLFFISVLYRNLIFSNLIINNLENLVYETSALL